VIQQRLENPLAAQLLAGSFTDGDRIKIGAKQHQFTFEKV
jgi:ATP-dependent Clp protease ATP-binding subunit ClpA